MRFADDLSVEQIGAIYGVHRATAARWVAKARDDVFRATRTELVARLQTKLGPSELDSFVAVMRSRLEFSISSILRTPPG